MRADSFSRNPISAPSRRSLWAELTQNRIIALVLAMIVAVPLLAAPADYKLTGIAAMTLEGFALVLMTALLWRAKWDLRAENVQRFFKTGANLPILLLLGLMTLSCVFSPSPVFSIQETLRTGAGILLYFVMAYQFRQSKHLSLLVSVVLALAAVVAVGGMAQYQLFDQGRADAVFGNPQPLASFVMLLLPVVAALAWTDKSSTRRIVAMTVSVLMVGCLMLTQGRGAWLGAAAGLLMLAYLATRPLASPDKPKASGAKASHAGVTQTGATRSKPAPTPLRARKHHFVWPLAVVLITVGFLAITRSQNAAIEQRAATSTSLAEDGSWQWRLQVWDGAIDMIKAKPLTGWGVGLYPLYQHQFTGEGIVISGSGLGTRVSLAEQAHNYYLQTAAELGLPGLLLTLATFVCFLSVGLRRVKGMEPGVRRTLLMGSLAAITAFLVDAIASPSWQYGHTAMFLWMMLGIGTSCLRPRVKREESVEVHAASRRISLMSRPLAVAMLLVGILLLPTGYASAQSVNYSNGSDAGQVIAGVAIAGSLLYFLATAAESVVAPPAGSGGFSGGAGANPGTGGAGGSAVNVPPVADATPTPTPIPVAVG